MTEWLNWTEGVHLRWLISTFSMLCMEKEWQPTPVSLPGKSHGQRSLVGCSPWGRKESGTTERLTLTQMLCNHHLYHFQNILITSKVNFRTYLVVQWLRIHFQMRGTWSGNMIFLNLGRSHGEGNGSPLQYHCLENLMDRGAWWTAVHGVAKSQAWLSN